MVNFDKCFILLNILNSMSASKLQLSCIITEMLTVLVHDLNVLHSDCI